jgi:acetyltransferase-like isoleucine patch superfamily enzyme
MCAKEKKYKKRGTAIMQNCMDKANMICQNHIKKQGDGEIVTYKGSKFILDESAELIVDKTFQVNPNCVRNNDSITTIRMEEGSKFRVKGNFLIYDDGDIACLKNSKLEIGSGYLNSNVKILCSKEITIGKNVAISRDVIIMDTDENYKMSEPIHIEDNVWIGEKSVISKGVTIGEGAIIAPETVVTEDVPANSMVGGMPAKIIQENILLA